jgi:excisionase family DNA binding protein
MRSCDMNGGPATAQPISQLFEPLIGVSQMAELLQRHPKTVQAMCRSGAIRAMKEGKQWLTRLSELDAYVRSRLSSQDQSRRAEDE